MYATGLEASTVIWISRQFRDDFRRTFDWLNERTDRAVQFFGVEVGVVQIGDTGPMAPVFEVVSRPNDWAKGFKTSPSVGRERRCLSRPGKPNLRSRCRLSG